MNTSRFDEGALGIGDEGRHVRSEPSGEHLCNNLGDRMDETNRPIVCNPLCPILFWQEHHIRRVEPVEVRSVEGVETSNGPHEVVLDSAPTLFEE